MNRIPRHRLTNEIKETLIKLGADMNKFEKWDREQKELEAMLVNHGIDINKVYCGASCGKGWFKIIDDLIVKLNSLGWDKDLQQIKEKFGGLRFYVGKFTYEMGEAIANAEVESLKTCEDCGDSGRPMAVNGWVRTLCEGCRNGE